MKKSLILALALVAPAMAGDEKAAPIVDIPPAPPAVSAWGIELGFNMNYAMSDAWDVFHDVNTYGLDLTASYKLNDNWSVNLRLGWAKGSDAWSGILTDDYGNCLASDSDKLSILNWSIAPGIRYTAAITDKLSWFAGANIGLGVSDIEYSWCYDITGLGTVESEKESDDEVGMFYSVEAGLRYNVSTSCYVFGSAIFSGTTANPDETDEQFSFGFRAGVGFEF